MQTMPAEAVPVPIAAKANAESTSRSPSLAFPPKRFSFIRFRTRFSAAGVLVIRRLTQTDVKRNLIGMVKIPLSRYAAQPDVRMVFDRLPDCAIHLTQRSVRSSGYLRERIGQCVHHEPVRVRRQP